MDATKLPKQQSQEINTDGRPINLPGIYVHKDTGAKYITAEGLEGTTQADALMSPNWEKAWQRTGDVPSRLELKKMREDQLKKDTAIIEGSKDKTPEKSKVPEGGETYDPKVK